MFIVKWIKTTEWVHWHPFLDPSHVSRNESLEETAAVNTKPWAKPVRKWSTVTCAPYVNCLQSLKSRCSTWKLKEIESGFKDSSYAFILPIGRLDFQWLSRRCHFRPKYQTSDAKTAVCGPVERSFLVYDYSRNSSCQTFQLSIFSLWVSFLPFVHRP